MKLSNPKRTLLLAIGNSGRRDDGLGWAFADTVDHFEGDIEYRYQLQVEDAELISRYDRVLFVDAWQGEGKEPYQFGPCPVSEDFGFSTHALEPGAVLFLCREVYGHEPEAWLLGIRGYEWELKCGLSARAWGNLRVALGAVAVKEMELEQAYQPNGLSPLMTHDH